jgi:dipeptide transport system substrate-binding protein
MAGFSYVRRKSMIRCRLRQAVITSAALFATGMTVSAPPAQAAGKTLVYCSEASPAGFDNAQQTTSVEAAASAYTVYERLVEFERGATRVVPGLAERWEISPDGLTYTFHLRHGVKWQTTAYFKPTREFNADDVLFSFNRLLDPGHPFQKAYPATYPYVTDMGLDKNIAKVEKVDPYTVRFTLKAVDAPFLQDMAMSFLSIVSAEYGDQLLKAGKAADLNQQPVGTGPFVFRSYQKDATIRFDANPDYWNPSQVKLGKLIFSITPDPTVRIQKLRSNECQITSQPRPADLETVRNDPKLALPSQVGFNLGYLAYNVEHKPLGDLRVRQALDMAINKPAIIRSIYQGAGQAASNPMPPTEWSYDKSLKDAPYDPEKAKALLKQAGASDLTITLWAMPVQRPYNPNARLMAEMIQADWAKIGVTAKIVTYEWGEYLKRARAGEHDTILVGWTGDNGDPDNWLSVLLGCDAINGSNYSKWCNKPFNDAVIKARHTTDQNERTKLYMEAQQIFKREVPFTPIAHSTTYQPMSRTVTDFRIDPFGTAKFSGVGIK